MPFVSNGGYYTLADESIEEVARRWADDDIWEKAYDARVHAWYPIGRVLPYREYRWTREDARRSPEEWDELKEAMASEGWDENQPVFMLVGRDGKVQVGEGNHRLAIAKELGIDMVPVQFQFRQAVPGGVPGHGPMKKNPAKRPVEGCPHTHCGPERPWPGIGQSIRECKACGTTLSRPDPNVDGYEEALAEGDFEGYEENPPWSDNLIAENMDEMIESGLPFPTGPGEELGEGHYGVVYATDDPEVVFKVSSDPTEAHFVKRATPLGFPDGIVKYKAIIDFEGTRRKRATYGIWREAAFEVGLRTGRYYGAELSRYDERNLNDFEAHLQSFRRTAALARDTIKKKPAMLERAMSEGGKRWAWDNAYLDMVDPAELGRGIWSHSTAAQPLARFQGWQRIAGALRGCEMLAEMMEHNNPMSQSVGAALGFYLDNDILLADVHSNNVGTVKRDDEYGERTLWVITDPGHAVFLDEL